jgi:nucleoid DNA-binding protein
MATAPANKSAPAHATKKAAPVKLAATEGAVLDTAATGEATATLVSVVKVKDLIERVVSTSDQNKREVRVIVEATLLELGKALEAGESLNLPPLGKLRIANQRRDDQGVAMTLKLRRGSENKQGKKAEKEALAEVGEDS